MVSHSKSPSPPPTTTASNPPVPPPTQAPRKPTTTPHRAAALARLADPTLPRRTHRADNVVTDAFLENKRDRQHVRRSAFRSQIASAAVRSNRGKVVKPSAGGKPRRPGKKLVTTLSALADALPEVEYEGPSRGRFEDAEHRRHQSLPSRPGAQKRRQKLVREEVRRFSKNLGQLMVLGKGGADVPAPSSSARVADAPTREDAGASVKQPTNRWAALRGFISATMEQNPIFEPKA